MTMGTGTEADLACVAEATVDENPVCVQGPAATKEQQLLDFLRGAGQGPGSYTLEEVLRWNHGRLERQHNYIQWLFPTDEASKFNAEAPLLTPELCEAARNDEVVVGNVSRSLDVFLCFLGLELLTGPKVSVRKRATFKERAEVCWRVNCACGNHNWLRLARVLKSLRLLGLASEMNALLDCLTKMWVRREIPAMAEAAVKHWHLSAGRPASEVPPRRGESCIPFPLFGSN